MTVHTEILLIAIAVSIACAIPGVFLVLRRMSMMADAITHTVFLGIVLAFFMTEDLNSPFLLVGATLVGVGHRMAYRNDTQYGACQRRCVYRHHLPASILYRHHFSQPIQW